MALGAIYENAALRAHLNVRRRVSEAICALGAQADGNQHGLAHLSSESFGHTGLSGMTVAFTQADLTFAVHTNSVTDPLDAPPELRRAEWLGILLDGSARHS